MYKLRFLKPIWWRSQIARFRSALSKLEVSSNNLESISHQIDSKLLKPVEKPYQEISWFGWAGTKNIPIKPSEFAFKPGSVKQKDVLSPDYLYWMAELGIYPRIHNKLWQYYSLLQNVHTHFGDIETVDRKAIVFGVGQEPTVALLASKGWKVTASDYFENGIAQEWAGTNQLSQNLVDLNKAGICDEQVFISNVELINMDMNSIPTELDEKFDLVWSLCALGHIGSYQNGIDFVKRSRQLLKPGGIAVHTTEMDYSSELERLDTPDLSLYKAQDIQSLLSFLKQDGCNVPEHDFELGPGILDNLVDVAPYAQHPHLQLDIFGHRTVPTSIVFSK